MRTILIPFDGSDSALRAVAYGARLARDIPALQPELFHVFQRAVTGPDDALHPDQLEQLHAGDMKRILAPARKLLDDAGVSHRCHCRVGSPANEIARYAFDTQCESIIMGTRGMSPAASLFIGSVATRVVHLVAVPVTLVK